MTDKTELVVPEATKYQIIEYHPTAIALADLTHRFANVVFPVDTPAGLEVAKKARLEIRTLRTTLEKKRQEIKKPALERARLIDSEAKELTEFFVTLEDPIDVQIKNEETRKDREREEARAAEVARINLIHKIIGDMRLVPATLLAAKAPTAKMLEAIKALDAVVCDMKNFGEFAVAADEARAASIAAINAIIAEREADAAERAQLKAEHAALKELRDKERKEFLDAKIVADAKALADHEQLAEGQRILAAQKAAFEAELAKQPPSPVKAANSAVAAVQEGLQDALRDHPVVQHVEKMQNAFAEAVAEVAGVDAQFAEVDEDTIAGRMPEGVSQLQLIDAIDRLIDAALSVLAQPHEHKPRADLQAAVDDMDIVWSPF